MHDTVGCGRLHETASSFWVILRARRNSPSVCSTISAIASDRRRAIRSAGMRSALSGSGSSVGRHAPRRGRVIWRGARLRTAPEAPPAGRALDPHQSHLRQPLQSARVHQPATRVPRLAVRARDQRRRRPPVIALTRADAATAASPDKGEVAGSIPASPTPPTRAKVALTRDFAYPPAVRP